MFTLENAAQFAAENRWLLCRLTFGIYLIILSVMDIKRRKLKLTVLLSGVLFIPAGVLCRNEIPAAFLLAGGAVGTVFLAVSKVTEEAFGYGDSVLILIMGGFLGFWDILALLTGAFILAAAFSLVLLIRSRFQRKDTFPFVTFLTAAYLGGMAFGIY